MNNLQEAVEKIDEARRTLAKINVLLSQANEIIDRGLDRLPITDMQTKSRELSKDMDRWLEYEKRQVEKGT